MGLPNVAIEPNSISGQTIFAIDDDYTLLDQTSVFENIIVNGVASNYNFNVSADTIFSAQSVTYTADTTTNFANPERGFYKPKETTTSSFDLLNLNSLINQRVNILLRYF